MVGGKLHIHPSTAQTIQRTNASRDSVARCMCVEGFCRSPLRAPPSRSTFASTIRAHNAGTMGWSVLCNVPITHRRIECSPPRNVPSVMTEIVERVCV